MLFDSSTGSRQPIKRKHAVTLNCFQRCGIPSDDSTLNQSLYNLSNYSVYFCCLFVVLLGFFIFFGGRWLVLLQTRHKHQSFNRSSWSEMLLAWCFVSSCLICVNFFASKHPLECVRCSFNDEQPSESELAFINTSNKNTRSEWRKIKERRRKHFKPTFFPENRLIERDFAHLHQPQHPYCG